MISPENVGHLCQLFSKFTELDNIARESAENEVNKLIQIDFIEFITNCSAIIMDDNANRNIIFFAIQNIARALTPYNVSINCIRERWMNVDLNIRIYIKTAVFRGLMFQEESITNMASKVICILALIEREEFFPLIQQIILLVMNEQNDNANFDSERCALSGLYVLNELLSPPYYSNHINDIKDIKNFLHYMSEQIFDIFAKIAPSKSDSYKEMVASVLNSLILCASPLYQKNEVLNAIIQVVLHYFSSNPSNDLYSTLCKILFNLAIVNYSKKNFDFSIIFNIITNEITNQENLDHLSNAIYFWSHLSKFEIDILQNVIKYKKLLDTFKKKKKLEFIQSKAEKISFPVPQMVNNFSKGAAINLAERLLFILTLINPNDISPEQKDGPKEPHMYATICLSNFFKLNHRIVFESICNFWISTISSYQPENSANYNLLFDEKVPWTTKHALLLSISLICDRFDDYRSLNADGYINHDGNQLLSNIDYDQTIINDIINFLTTEITSGFRIFDDFLLQSVYSPIPRIVDTALYSIRMCVKHLHIGIQYSDPESAPFSFLMSAFKRIMAETKYDETIFSRILYILSIHFIKFGEYVNYALIINFQDDILSIIGFGLSAPFNSYYIYVLTNKVLQNIICYAPEQNMDLLSKILNMTMNTLIELMKFSSDETIIKQQHSLNIIMLIFRRSDFRISEELLIDSSRIIFQLMEQKNLVFEDALRCLNVIILKLQTKSNQMIDKVLNLIPIALSSKSPSIITVTTATLANLYKENSKSTSKFEKNGNLPLILIEFLPQAVDLIISCLDDSAFSRDLITPLLIKLADLIKAARFYIPIMKAIEIKNIYFNYASTPLNLSNEYDIEYANDLFEGIYAGLSSILKIYMCYDPEIKSSLATRKTAREFFDIPIKNYIYLNNYTEGSLYNYCKFILSSNKFFGNVASAMINRAHNFKPLFYACATDNDELNKKARKTATEMIKA